MDLLNIHRDLYIVPGYPFLYLGKDKVLVMADIHLGYEEAVAQEGVFLPRAQLSYLISELNSVFRGLDIESVIVVGDLKHRFDRISRQEREETEYLIKFLRDKRVRDIILVKGNHDNYVSVVTKKLGVEIREDLIFEDILFIHGHIDPFESANQDLVNKVNLVIYGHEHPSITLRDSLGRVGKLPIFLEMPLNVRDKMIKALILPATGYYQLGSSITLDPSKYLSPITQRYGLIKEAKPYAILREESVFEMPPLELMSDYLDLTIAP